jgi:hypothetical protein
MNKTRARIQYKLNEIKAKKIMEDLDDNWYSIEITFSTEKFYRRCGSISEFNKFLTNSKMGLNGVSNREWYSRLDASGFYFFNETNEILEIRYLMDTKRKMSMTEFKARVFKICPFIEIDISFKDYYKYEKLFSKDIFAVYNSGMVLFGNLKNPKAEIDIDAELPF